MIDPSSTEDRTTIAQISRVRQFQVRLLNLVQKLDFQTITEWTKTLQKGGSLGFYGMLSTITLSTYFISDLVVLTIEGYLPDAPSSNALGKAGSNSLYKAKSINDYNPIFARNLFNSKNLIPGDDNLSGISESLDVGGPSVKTTLPMNLIGTLIMVDPAQSIATLEDKSASMVYPMRIEDEIPNKLKMLKIEPRRATFLNRASGRKEFVELPEDTGTITHNVITPGTGSGIEKISATQFNINKSEVDKALADMNNILTQARAVPNFENGAPAGYKLFQIVPGSIYDKLGLQNGDVIAGLNGQPIADPGKAFEMLSELKTSNHMELQVKKDGKQLTYSYDIH